MGEGWQADARAEVCEESEVFAQRQQGAAFGLEIGRQGFPFGSAHRAEEDGLRRFAGGDGGGWQRVAGGVQCRTADEVVAAFDGKAVARGDGVEDAEGLGHDFGADAVAGQDGDAMRAGHGRAGWCGGAGLQGRMRRRMFGA